MNIGEILVRGIFMKSRYVAMSVLLLAGCSHSSQADANGSGSGSGVVCPKSQEPNILGVGLGMRPTDVVAALKCANADGKFSVKPENRGMQGTDASKYQLPQITRGVNPVSYIEAFIYKNPGTTHYSGAPMLASPADSVTTRFIGMPGHEWAYSVERIDDNIPGASPPPIASVISSFETKYGQPTATDQDNGSNTLYWYKYPNGSAIPQGAQDFRDCDAVLVNRYIESYCGTLIRVNIARDNNNAAVHIEVRMFEAAKAAEEFSRELTVINRLNSPTGATPQL